MKKKRMVRWFLIILGTLGIACAGLAALLLWEHFENAKYRHPTPSVIPIRVRFAQIEKAAQIYSMGNNGNFPASLDELTQLTYEGKPLLEKKYLLDPWGEPIQYERTGRHRCIIRSSGPDKIMGTDDDITN